MTKYITSQNIFILLISILPVNLGLHFVQYDSYVNGLLVDYLIPTIFLQDVLAAILLILWFIENRGTLNFSKILGYKKLIYLALFLYILFITSVFSERSFISLAIFVRVFLYFLVGIYFATRKQFLLSQKKLLLNILEVQLILLSILACFQYYGQGSVFDNYAFFGEQPYSYSTPGIAHENVFGYTRVPAYGLFRHPNTFAGYLVILITIIFYFKRYKFILLGITALLLTFSYTAWFALVLGLIAIYKQSLARWVMLIFFCIGLALPLFQNILTVDNVSVSKRAELMSASYNFFAQKQLLFGCGQGCLLWNLEEYLVPTNYVRFLQPVHNVFVLLLVEGGLLAVVFLAYFLFLHIIKRREPYPLTYTILLQVLILLSFDHYLWTNHQTHLIFWLLVGVLI